MKNQKQQAQRWIISICFVIALFFNLFFIFFSDNIVYVKLSAILEIIQLLEMLNILPLIK
jgi:hypothetical protein